MTRGIKTNLYALFLRFRSWLDYEVYIPVLFRRKSRSDKFAEKIRCEMEKIMSREKFCYEEGKILIPTRYTILISEEDNAEWYGIKRYHLQQVLDSYVKSTLKAISLDSFNEQFVYIRSAQKIKEGEIKIIHQWEECEAPVEILFNGNGQMINGYDHRPGTIILPLPGKTYPGCAEPEYETITNAQP